MEAEKPPVPAQSKKAQRGRPSPRGQRDLDVLETNWDMSFNGEEVEENEAFLDGIGLDGGRPSSGMSRSGGNRAKEEKRTSATRQNVSQMHVPEEEDMEWQVQSVSRRENGYDDSVQGHAVAHTQREVVEGRGKKSLVAGPSPLKLSKCRFCDRDFTKRSLKVHQKKCFQITKKQREQQQQQARASNSRGASEEPSVIENERQYDTPYHQEEEDEEDINAYGSNSGWEEAECKAPIPRNSFERKPPAAPAEQLSVRSRSRSNSWEQKPRLRMEHQEDEEISIQSEEPPMIRSSRVSTESQKGSWEDSACVAPVRRSGA